MKEVAHLPDEHPIWGILRLSIGLGALTAILWNNASSFDWTEIKSILEMVVAIGVLKGGEAAIKRRMK